MSQAIEGVGTTLTIGSATLCYVAIQGLGMEGGDKLEATCLDNTLWKTYLPQTLKEVPDLTFRAKFDPADWTGISAEINVNQSLVLNFLTPLGAITFWGYLRSFTPEEGVVGTAWEGTGTIVVTNLNASEIETGPVYA